MTTPDPPDRVVALAWGVLPGRSALVVRGPDAVGFVNNFTTAAVAELRTGTGTEGFFTDARGHVLALANILRVEEGLWIDAAPGCAAALHRHLDHHLVRERVEFVDATADRGTILLVGRDARPWLTGHATGAVPTHVLAHGRAHGLAHGRALVAGVDAAVACLDWWGPGGLLLQASRSDADHLAAWLRAAGLPHLDAAAVDAARIEAGSPEPADIDARTLPQELGRDDRAISFTKGCYLGQETVARLDALGHVNRRLVVLATAAPPAVGAAVTAGGTTVGRVTSACTSPRLGCGLGLALVHARGLDGGLEIDGAPSRVVPAPARESREET